MLEMTTEELMMLVQAIGMREKSLLQETPLHMINRHRQRGNAPNLPLQEVVEVAMDAFTIHAVRKLLFYMISMMMLRSITRDDAGSLHF